ncbi:hypothetical protein M9H77_37269 [Catharanthus roseus]|uniref:Uncharacterized protein n=1 Tax=Catharanthus roseus TaxID=4058 RepID=A0ACB9ZV80_CATRO|nr:hypothetical protein M9H77_37269 [Catharanthus roseus]
MVCLGIIFGCKPSSATSYILSALIVIAILAAIRLLCYAIYRLLHPNHDHQTIDYYGSESSDNVIEIPPPSSPSPPPTCAAVASEFHDKRVARK